MIKKTRTYSGRKIVSSVRCQENWKAPCKRMKLEHSLTPYININSKWIKDLGIWPDTLRLLKKSIGQTLSDLNHSSYFSDLPPRVMTVIITIKKKMAPN